MSWQKLKLAEFCKTGSGSTPSRSKASDYYGGTIPWVKSGELKEQEICDTVEKVTKKALAETAIKMVPKGALLIAMYGATVGRMAFLGTDATMNQAVCHIITDHSACEVRYLFYCLQNMIPQLLNKRVGGGQPNINQQIIKNLEIPLPPLAEQKRIAAILDKADAIRRKRQAAIKLADDFLRATFLDMFGDPVTNPKGWEVKELGEITFIDAPMVDPKESQHLDLLHIGPDRIEKETGKLLPAKTAREDRLISGKFLFSDNHVLYSKIRPYLRKVALPGFCGLCSADMYPVRPDEEYLTREYLWSILISPAFTHFTESLPGRANIPKINRKEFASYKCMLPTIELQKKYTDIFNNSKKIERKKAFAFDFNSDLFNSLTQRAFRGEL